MLTIWLLFLKKMQNVMSTPTCIITPLNAKVGKGCKSHLNTITLQYVVGLCRCNMPFVDVEMKECIEHVGDEEEE